MHVAGSRASGRADPADNLAARHLLAHRHLYLCQVVVRSREGAATPVRMPDHDTIAVATGPACVHDNPVEGRPGGIAAWLAEVDPVMPALPVGERVGAVPEAGGGGVVGDWPADEVAVSGDGRPCRDDAHRVDDQVSVLDQPRHEGRHSRGRCGHRGERGTVRTSWQGSDRLRHGDVGQRATDQCHTEDQQNTSTEPPSMVTPGEAQAVSGLQCAPRNEGAARGGHVVWAECAPKAAPALHNGH